jgi:hypothetical protein
MTTTPQHRRAVLHTWRRRHGRVNPEPAALRQSERISQGRSVMAVAWAAQAVRHA